MAHNFILKIPQSAFRQRSQVALFHAVDEYNGGSVYLNPDTWIHIPEYSNDDD